MPLSPAVAALLVICESRDQIGGMLAITWTDVIQGSLMLAVVVGTAAAMIYRLGSPLELMRQATAVAPELGQVTHRPVSSYMGYFVIWATAIPIIPHVVMRVLTAKDAKNELKMFPFSGFLRVLRGQGCRCVLSSVFTNSRVKWM